MQAYTITEGLIDVLLEGIYSLKEKDQKSYESGEMGILQMTVRKEDQDVAIRFLRGLKNNEGFDQRSEGINQQ